MTAATASKRRRVNHGRGHSYYGPDGGKYAGVTTIIGNGLPKPALVGWASGTVGEFVADRLQIVDGHIVADEVVDDLVKIGAERERPIPDWRDAKKLPRTKLTDGFKGLPYYDRDRAGNRGTEVHGLAQRLAEGEEITVPEELVGHVDAYLKFRDEWAPFDEVLEFQVFNDTHQYAGTPDLDCRLGAAPALGRCLIDLKTNRSGPFGEVALQLAAYRYAEVRLIDGVEEPMPEFDTCLVLWLRADGYELYPFEAGPVQFRQFLYVQQVAQFLDGSRDLKGAALPPPRAS